MSYCGAMAHRLILCLVPAVTNMQSCILRTLMISFTHKDVNGEVRSMSNSCLAFQHFRLLKTHADILAGVATVGAFTDNEYDGLWTLYMDRGDPPAAATSGTLGSLREQTSLAWLAPPRLCPTGRQNPATLPTRTPQPAGALPHFSFTITSTSHNPVRHMDTHVLLLWLPTYHRLHHLL